MTVETRLAELLETVEAPSNRGRLTHDWVAENIDLEVADTIYAAINSVSPATALRFAAGVGIDLEKAFQQTMPGMTQATATSTLGC